MILHVYSGNLYGGIETHLLNLIEADFQRSRTTEHRRKHQLALCFRGRLSHELNQIGLDAFRLGEVRFRSPYSVWRARRELLKIIRKYHIRALVAHASWAYRLAQPVARKARIPIAFWNHDLLLKQNNPFEQYAAKHRPDWLITNSQYTVECTENLFKRKVDAVIYPLTRLKPVEDRENQRLRLRNELSTPESDTVIIQFCRFERWKGHAVLIEALGKIGARGRWTAWFAGGVQRPAEQKYLDELKQLAGSLGILHKVRFLGPRTDIPELLCAADVHCQANLQPEPFGLAYVEALSAGLPVVASSIGGAVEIVSPDCGFLIEPGNSTQLAKTLEMLIENQEIIEQFGKNGVKRAQQLSDPGIMLTALENLVLKSDKRP